MKFERATIDGLSGILYDFHIWRCTSTKMEDIQALAEFMLDRVDDRNPFAGLVVTKLKDIRGSCDEYWKQIDARMRSYGIAVEEDDFELDMWKLEKQILKILKSKLVIRMRDEMPNNRDAIGHMQRYIDVYFENFAIDRTKSDIVESIKDWIHYIQDNGLQIC